MGLGKQKCRFIKAWQNYSVGHEIWPPGVLRDWLLQHGYIEIVEDEPQPVVEKPKRRRGRPRKKAIAGC